MASERAAPSQEVREAAREIMKMADRHARNGQLTILELDTFLSGTEHQGFLDWLRSNRSRVFKEFDKDDDEDLDLRELERAVARYDSELAQREKEGGARLARVTRSLYSVSAKIAKAASDDTALANNWFRLFKRFDHDGSGMLDYGEIKKVVRKGLKLTWAEVPERDLRTLWTLLDRDGSGFVTAGEFSGFMRNASAKKLRPLVLAHRHPPPLLSRRLLLPHHTTVQPRQPPARCVA